MEGLLSELENAQGVGAKEELMGFGVVACSYIRFMDFRIQA